MSAEAIQKNPGLPRSLCSLAMTALAAISSTITVPCYAANPQDLEKLAQLKTAQSSIHLDLSNADLRQYPFAPGKIDLQQANMSHSNLSGVDLSKLNLSGVDLSYSDLSSAKLNQVNLAGANLDHANLVGAQIQQSNLANVNLAYANLAQANLQESSLKNANLTCANLNQANLTKSVFTEANISGASFVNTITTEISGYSSAIDNKIGC